MGDGIPPALKWLGAFVVMALVVIITIPLALDAITQSFRIDDTGRSPALDEDPITGEAQEPPQEAELGAVEDGEASALADVSGRNGAVRQADEAFVAIGGVQDDAVYFAFPLIEGDPDCVERATVELTLLQATASTLGVYPANVPELSELTDGDPLPEEPFLTAEPRAVAETDGTPGVLIWDVTGLYWDWAAGAFTEVTEPFVVAVRPVEYGDGDLRAQFASVEAGEEDAGRLVWTADAAC